MEKIPTAPQRRQQKLFYIHILVRLLVKKSFSYPVETFLTNSIGTLNILESLREIKKKCNVIIITSDKCYDNVEWEWGYRETDLLGGPDPYSASKGAAELAIKSHIKSYIFSSFGLRILQSFFNNPLCFFDSKAVKHSSNVFCTFS